MDDRFPRCNLLPLEPGSAVTGRPSSYNVLQDPHRAGLVSNLGISGHKFPTQLLADFYGWFRAPAIRFLGPSYDGTAFEVSRDAKGPTAICVLAGYSCVAEVGDQAGLA